jgi:superfamily I DNA/RNA helicase/RecB family exonuclease
MRTAPLALDALQRRAVEHDDGALLVLGRAGTGKTAVLLERFVRLVDAGADPDRIVLVVRTRRDRRVARETLLRRLARSLPGLRVVTAHGLALDVVNRRFEALGYGAAPQLLTATEQYERVRELLAGEDADDWPAYGSMLRLEGFADQIRQFLRRAQEARRSPEELLAAAEAADLGGWGELSGFYRRYLDVLYDRGEVDFAGLIVQAGNAAAVGDPLYDHVMVDDYQEATVAIARLLVELRPTSLVVAGDTGSHVFSFQGTTDRPLREFAGDFPGGSTVELDDPFRYEGSAAPAIEAWSGLHTSEEHAAIARELRRIHVEEDVPWHDLGVVVRRAGTEAAGLVRALDDAGVPRVVPETRLALQTQPATFPYLLALRWLAAPDERDALIESVLTSELAGLSPAAARGLLRSAAANGLPPSRALELEEGLSPDEAALLTSLRKVLDRAAAVAGRSVLDAFALLWRELACSRRLVDATDTFRGRSDMEAIRSLADAVERVSQQDDPSVARFLELMDRGEGPGFGAADAEDADAVRVLTAHGAAGREFDTVVIAGVLEGNFPSLSRPEPMFDLESLERVTTQAQRNRLRLEDERRLFRVAVSRARRRALLTASQAGSGEPSVGAPSRFAAEAGAEWTPFPGAPSAGEPLSTAEAAATWRRDLARTDERPAVRLAAIEGLVALGVDPSRWWFQRDWTDTGTPLHEHVRVSYSRLEKLENCALQYVLGEELGLENRAGYHAWVGSLVHTLIEECEDGRIERSEEALVAAANERWRPQEFPSKAVSEAFRIAVTGRMLPAWIKEYGEVPSRAQEVRFEFEVDDATVTGYIDRVGALQTGGSIITDYKTGKKSNTKAPEENLQLGIYYLAMNAAPELKEFLPVKAVELTFLKERSKGAISRSQLALTPTLAGEYATEMRERLESLIGRVRDLLTTEVYRPNPAANCFHCRFKPLCPLYPEGRPVLPVEVAS